MSSNGNGCFACGRDLVLGKVRQVEAWHEDCLYDVELICTACDCKVRVNGTMTLTRGERVFILRPLRRVPAA